MTVEGPGSYIMEVDFKRVGTIDLSEFDNKDICNRISYPGDTKLGSTVGGTAGYGFPKDAKNAGCGTCKASTSTGSFTQS